MGGEYHFDGDEAGKGFDSMWNRLLVRYFITDFL